MLTPILRLVAILSTNKEVQGKRTCKCKLKGYKKVTCQNASVAVTDDCNLLAGGILLNQMLSWRDYSRERKTQGDVEI
jgi:hypothetical protein